jgi:hypothetical protein
LVLVKPAAPRRKPPAFRTDDVIPHSGIYRVLHQKHRLPHEVTLLRDQKFPRCAQCQDAVVFEMLQAAQDETEVNDKSVRIYLYELPVFDDDRDQDIAV